MFYSPKKMIVFLFNDYFHIIYNLKIPKKELKWKLNLS